MSTADLLLHPIRLRIVEAFLGDRALTTAELQADLPDVPATSLYRHVARLVDAGVLSVVAERRVRGAVERTYVLRAAAARLNPDEITKMTPEEHRQTFLAFIAGLVGDFDRYLAQGDVDPVHDGVTFNLAAMWLTDTELIELARELYAVLQPRLAHAPDPDASASSSRPSSCPPRGRPDATDCARSARSSPGDGQATTATAPATVSRSGTVKVSPVPYVGVQSGCWLR